MVTVPDGGTVKVLETLRDDTKSQQQKTNSTHATLRVYSMSDIMSCVHAHVTHVCLSQYECKRNAHTHLTALLVKSLNTNRPNENIAIQHSTFLSLFAYCKSRR